MSAADDRDSAPAGWRIAVVSTAPPVVAWLAPRLAELGHEVAVVVAAKRPRRPGPPELQPARLLELAPGADVVFPASKTQVEPLLRAYAPDLLVCCGYPWKLPPEALAVPRLGAVNQHPSLLPRHRGPLPLAWTLRSGDAAFGITWHRMDAELDTGPTLAQGSVPVEDDDVSIEAIAPRLQAATSGLLPRVLERIAAGDPGDPQPPEGATWAGYFGEDYAEIDWGRTAREIHDQVRAWALTFGLSPVRGPFAEVEGERVRVLQTSLAERPDAVRVEAGDGPIWVVATEPEHA
jgi:methionyl-tRNA formyltransferase